jgi:hypothetical protein
VPQQVYLHGQWLGKRHQECLPLDGQEVIPLAWYFMPFFSSPENVCLGTSFLLDITVPTAFVLQPHKWSKIFRLVNHLSVYTQWPFPFITQPVNNTEHCVVFWVGSMYHSTYF